MATTPAQRLRRDLGIVEPNDPETEGPLTNEQAQDLLDEAGESYTDTASANAYARVIAIQGILASTSKLVTYKENTKTENLSDVFNALRALLKIWQDNLAKAVANTTGNRKVPRDSFRIPTQATW